MGGFDDRKLLKYAHLGDMLGYLLFHILNMHYSLYIIMKSKQIWLTMGHLGYNCTISTRVF